MASRSLYTTSVLFCVATALAVCLPESLATLGNLGKISINGAEDTLQTTARVFKPAQMQRVVLKKASTERDGIQCPSANIIHEKIGPIPLRGDVFWVPHSLIVQNGVRCGTGKSSEYMLVVNGADIAKEEIASARGLKFVWDELATNKRGMSSFNALNAIDPVYVGIEATAHRQCGGKILYPRGSVFLFISPSLTNINLGFAYFPKFSVGMLSVLNNQNLCAYVNGVPRHTDKKPSPSPVQSVAAAPAKPFALTAPKVSALPTPSVSPVAGAAGAAKTATKPAPAPAKQPTTKKAAPSPSKKAAPKAPAAAPPVPAKPSTSAPAKPSTPPTAAKSPDASPTPKVIAEKSTSNSTQACFPSSATVELISGEYVAMPSLQVGDVVRTGPSSFSDIFMFTHKDESTKTEFVRIEGRSGTFVDASPGHFMSINGELVPARNVVVGDLFELASGETDVVVHLSRKWMQGLHNPQTVDGNIAVNGVICSTFTESIVAPVATAILAPVRALHVLDLWQAALGSIFHESDHGILGYLPAAISEAGRGNKQVEVLP